MNTGLVGVEIIVVFQSCEVPREKILCSGEYGGMFCLTRMSECES